MKKILALLLAAILVLGMLPTMAFATTAGTFTDLQDLVYAAADGATITLDKDYTYIEADEDYTYKKIIIQNPDSTGKTLTIDLNGHTVTGEGENGDCFQVGLWNTSPSKLTIKDSSQGKTGKICSSWYGIYLSNYDQTDEDGNPYTVTNELVFESGKICGCKQGIYNSSGKVIIKDGEITGNGCGICNYDIMAISGGSITNNSGKLPNAGNMGGLENYGDLYLGGNITIKNNYDEDNNPRNISLVKYEETDYYPEGSGIDPDYYSGDCAIFTIGDGTPVSDLGDYVVPAPANGFNIGVTISEETYTEYFVWVDMGDWGYYDYDWDQEEYEAEFSGGRFTTNGVSSQLKYFSSDCPDYSVKFVTDHFELVEEEEEETETKKKNYNTVTIGENRTEEKAEETKAGEENPDTGAPVLSMSTGIAVLFGAAFVLSKKK